MTNMTPFVTRVGPQGLVAWRTHVADCYLKMGFLEPSECPDGQAHDRYDARSLHFSLTSDTVQGAGTFRFVPYDHLDNHPLPITEAFEFGDWDLGDRFEITRLTTRRRGGFKTGLQGNLERSILFHAACYGVAFAEVNGLTGFVAMVDPDIFAAFNRRFANTMWPIPGTTMQHFKGGWVVPVYLDAATFREQVANDDPFIAGYLGSIQAADVQQ